ncbi:MAG: glycosyltransferase family 2 protein [Planctomycetota bacterium]
MPKVSVGIPVYNGDKFLRTCLDHVLAQTHKDLEIIISDNASTDGTEEICREYVARDDRIQYHRNETNVGAAPNYNRTVNLSTGQFFKFMAHDDLIRPTYVETCLNSFDEYGEDVIVCYPKTIHIDDAGTEVEEYSDRLDLDHEKPQDRLSHYMQNVRQCNAAHGLMRLDGLRKTRLIGAYNNSDMIFLAELLLLGKIREVPEPLFLRRVHEKSSRAANQTPEDLLKWFDTKARNRWVLPITKRAVEYLRAVRRSPLPFRTRMSCYRVVWRLFLKRYWRHMGSEVRRELKASLRRTFGRSKDTETPKEQSQSSKVPVNGK